MKKKVLSIVVLAFLLMPIVLTACSVSSSTAQCAFVVGNGVEESRIHKIIYPGGEVRSGNYEKVYYVPCNSRNYIVNNGTVLGVDNKTPVGDRFTPLRAYTITGIPIDVSVSAFWTLNQSKAAMEKFWPVCFKYTCASSEDVAGNVNSSTPGWNNLLAENFGPALQQTALEAVAHKADIEKGEVQITDAIWLTHDAEQYKALGNMMSDLFADAIRARLGYAEDLFCGSGNSQWDDPNKPGAGTFTCSPVRVVVESVDRVKMDDANASEGAVTLNEQRLKNAQALYGPFAGFWLGLMDTIDRCQANQVYCTFYIGQLPETLFAPSQVTEPTVEPTEPAP